MKKIALVLIALLFASSVNAEVPKDYIAQLRAQVKADEAVLVSKGMNFINEEASKKFWPLHREYVAERDKLVDQTGSILRDYASNYETMTDAKAKSLIEQVYELRGHQRQLQKKYVDRIGKEISPVVAARFMQIDNQLDLVKRINLAANIPLIKDVPQPKAAG